MAKTYDDPAKLAIGSTVWFRSKYHTRYAPGSTVNIAKPREAYRPLTIVGETPVSWIVEGDGKIPKDPAKRGAYSGAPPTPLYHNEFMLTEQAVEDACWSREHWGDVTHKVQHGCDPATFRAIGKLLGIE